MLRGGLAAGPPERAIAGRDVGGEFVGSVGASAVAIRAGEVDGRDACIGSMPTWHLAESHCANAGRAREVTRLRIQRRDAENAEISAEKT